MPQKRTTTQPLAAAPAPTKAGKSSKASKHSPTTTKAAALVPSSNSPGTPALTPSSSTTPPSSFTHGLSLARSSKKLTKAVRNGHGGGGHGGHGGAGGGGKGTMKMRKAAVEGPEAELSGDEESEEEDVSVVEREKEIVAGAGERVIEGLEGRSAPKSEVSMHTLLDGAKLRPETHNISRGYELLTSPASRLVIPFDSLNSIYQPNPSGRTGGGVGKFGSTPSSPSFSDDVEWEWEDLCFEMDGLDVSTRPAAGTTTPVRKDAYAEVVKRVAA